MVFGGGAEHRWPPDVDVFDGVFYRAAGLGDRSLKRIQVDCHEIYHAYAVLLGLRHVGRVGAQAQEAAVNLRMEGLYAPVHHFGKSRVV